MNTKAIGDITEGMVIAALLRFGVVVLVPFGDNQRYDIVFEKDGRFKRVQCKTGKLFPGRVTFATCSTYAHRGGKRKSYVGQVDYFGVYCRENGKVYLVPSEGLPGTEATLRIEPPSNPNGGAIRYANEYEI